MVSVITVSASDSIPKDNSNNEISTDDIERLGTKNLDEYGNEVIEIPISELQGDNLLIQNSTADGHNDYGMHQGHKSDSRTLRHASLTAHTHKVTNKKKAGTYQKTKVLTGYADSGFILTVATGESFNINLSASLNGGISLPVASAGLGVTVGTSFTKTVSNTYSKKIPKKYIGRIVYNYSTDRYTFTNETTYYFAHQSR
jgi:hypothetical protein